MDLEDVERLLARIREAAVDDERGYPYPEHHAPNALGFCSWCGWCLDCHPDHRSDDSGCDRRSR